MALKRQLIRNQLANQTANKLIGFSSLGVPELKTMPGPDGTIPVFVFNDFTGITNFGLDDLGGDPFLNIPGKIRLWSDDGLPVDIIAFDKGFVGTAGGAYTEQFSLIQTVAGTTHKVTVEIAASSNSNAQSYYRKCEYMFRNVGGVITTDVSIEPAASGNYANVNMELNSNAQNIELTISNVGGLAVLAGSCNVFIHHKIFTH